MVSILVFLTFGLMPPILYRKKEPTTREMKLKNIVNEINFLHEHSSRNERKLNWTLNNHTNPNKICGFDASVLVFGHSDTVYIDEKHIRKRNRKSENLHWIVALESQKYEKSQNISFKYGYWPHFQILFVHCINEHTFLSCFFCYLYKINGIEKAPLSVDHSSFLSTLQLRV